MSGNNSSRSSKIMVPEAKAAMDKFKIGHEVGIRYIAKVVG